MRLRMAGPAATLIVLTACSTPGMPTAGAHVTLAAPKPTPTTGEQTKGATYTQWIYFVSWSGLLGGSPITGMSEASIEGPPRFWDNVLAMVAKVQAANPGVEQVKIVSYNLMRIE